VAAVENRTLSQQVYEHMRAEILAGRYRPAAELNEVAVAEEMGVSRGPVREAFGRLRAEGLIEIRPHRGAVVSELSKMEFLDAYQMREVLEAFAMGLAVPKLSSSVKKELIAACESMDEAADQGDIVAFFYANDRFHRTLVYAADNIHLTRFYDNLTAQMGRYRHVSAELRGDLKMSITEHRQILDAILAGDVGEATELARAHVQVPQRVIAEISDERWAALRGVEFGE
jgi:DNA-binding GntR family transcriptional regulator